MKKLTALLITLLLTLSLCLTSCVIPVLRPSDKDENGTADGSQNNTPDAPEDDREDGKTDTETPDTNDGSDKNDTDTNDTPDINDTPSTDKDPDADKPDTEKTDTANPDGENPDGENPDEEKPDEPTTPPTDEEIKEKIDLLIASANEKLEKVDSYSLDSKATMSFMYADVIFSASSIISEQINLETSGSFIYSAKQSTTTESVYGKDTFEYNQKYYDGYMYRESFVDDEQILLCSPISKDDFIAYINEQSEGGLLEKLDELSEDPDAMTYDYKVNENGSYTVSLLSEHEGLLNAVLELLQVNELIQYSPESMSIVMQFTAEMLPEKVTLDFTFEEMKSPTESISYRTADSSAFLPELSAEYKYSEYNSTVIDLPVHENYRELSDLRVLTKVSDAFDELLTEPELFFITDMKNDINLGSQSSYTYEQDYVLYSNDDNGVFYDITADSDDGAYHLYYEYGTQYVYEIDGLNEYYLGESESGDEEAEAFIKSILFPVEFNHFYVTDVLYPETDANGYLFTLYIPDDVAAQLFPAGTMNRSCIMGVLAVFENDNLVEFEFIFSLTGTYRGQALDMEIVYNTKLLDEPLS